MGFYYKQSSNGVISASICGGGEGAGCWTALRTPGSTEHFPGVWSCCQTWGVTRGRATMDPAAATRENPLSSLEIRSYKSIPEGCRLDLNTLPCS